MQNTPTPERRSFHCVLTLLNNVCVLWACRTAPECGFSHRVLTILNESKVDYELLNVLDEEYNPGLREAVKQYRCVVHYDAVSHGTVQCITEQNRT